MPSVVFDCVGTLFGYENGAKGIADRLGDKLAKYGISPKVLFYVLVCSTERDYSYLSQIGQYKQFHFILLHTMKRTLFQVGIPAEDLEDFFTTDDVEYIRAEYMKLKARPGMQELIKILRDGNCTVWACSDASVERVDGYFKEAGVEMPMKYILSADMVNAGKPEAAVYKMALEKCEQDRPGEAKIFAAAHAWDCAAAQAAGFIPAYCTIYEHDPCEPVFGKFDIVVPDLVSLGNAIVDKYGKRQ